MTRTLLAFVVLVGAQSALAQPQLPGAPQRRLSPEGAIAPTCRIRTQVEARVAASSVHLRFFLVSTDPKPRVVKLTGACPAGLVQLTGLPAGFDAMHTCQRGACVNPVMEQTFTVPARGRVELSETELRARGDACNPPLPFGSTIFTAQIHSDDPMDVCGGGAVQLIREGTGRLRASKPSDDALPVTTPPVPKPAPTRAPGKVCPTCAFACLRGVPSQRVNADGCRVCGCDDPGF